MKEQPPLPSDTDTEIISPHGPSGSEFLSSPAHLPLLLQSYFGKPDTFQDCHLLPQIQLFLTKAGVKKLKVFFPLFKTILQFQRQDE